MKRSLSLFVALFVLAFAVITAVEFNKIKLNEAIEKAPAYATVTADDMTQKTKRGHSTYRINYSYQVAGTSYKFATEFMEEDKAKAMISDPSVQVAYAVGAPADAVLKSTFDSRDRDTSFAHVAVMAAGLGLFLSLIGTAVLVFKFPWFRQA